MSTTFINGKNLPVIRNKVANTALAASEKPKLFIEQVLPGFNLIVKYCMSNVKKVLFNVKSVKFGCQKQIKSKEWQSVLTSCDETIMKACWILLRRRGYTVRDAGMHPPHRINQKKICDP
jgi:hypothetical protein